MVNDKSFNVKMKKSNFIYKIKKSFNVFNVLTLDIFRLIYLYNIYRDIEIKEIKREN